MVRIAEATKQQQWAQPTLPRQRKQASHLLCQRKFGGGIACCCEAAGDDIQGVGGGGGQTGKDPDAHWQPRVSPKSRALQTTDASRRDSKKCVGPATAGGLEAATLSLTTPGRGATAQGTEGTVARYEPGER